MPKTGTTSVGAIFENFRSSKIAGSALERLGCDLREGLADAAAARAFVRERDEEHWLEMDPASANWMVVETLRDELPQAKFVFTIRDCFSWCDSMLNVLLGREIGLDFLGDPALFARLLGCPLDAFRELSTVLDDGASVLETLLAFWANHARIAAALPSDRTLVVRTDEISSSLGAMAAHVGVPVAALLPERSHSRVTARKFRVLEQLPADVVARAFAPHAESPFMREHFPGSSLAGFLERRARPRAHEEKAADVPRAPSDLLPVGYWLRVAEAALASGDSSLAERFSAHVVAQSLEPDEAQRVWAVRNALAARTTPAKVDDAAIVRAAIVGSRGHLELSRALTVLSVWSAQAVPERLGFHLDDAALDAQDDVCRAVLTFAAKGGEERALVFELELRDPRRSHWHASERFAVSYRREAPARGAPDERLARALLQAVERHVPRTDPKG